MSLDRRTSRTSCSRSRSRRASVVVTPAQGTAERHLLGDATADMTLNRDGHLYEDDVASLSVALDSSLSLVA